MGMIKKNADLLLLRYSDYRGHDFIQEHQHIIDRYGYTWVFKIGRGITEYKLKKVIRESGQLLFRAPKAKGGKIYISSILEYAYGQPKADYVFPKYYVEMLEDEREWQISSLEGSWLKIGAIEELPVEISKRMKLISSGKPMLDVLDSTMSSMIYGRFADTIDSNVKGDHK